MLEETPENCIRRRVEIAGDNYYIVQSRYKVQVTIPHENRPERLKERESVELLCQEVLNIANKRANDGNKD